MLVTDDADHVKSVAEALDVERQVCRAHVNRNVHNVVGALGTQALDHPHPVRWELKATGVTRDQFPGDLTTVEGIIGGIPGNGQRQLERLLTHYQAAPAPTEGHPARMWYRFRSLVTEWYANYSRLALHHHWRGKHGEQLDGTNYVTDQVIGQCVKERYRTARGYQRDTSILYVISPIA